MSEPVLLDGMEWRRVYGDKTALFWDGLAYGDYYAADQAGAWRVRCWPKYRLQGGYEELVLGKERAMAHLVELAQKRRAEERE